jgi:4-amino-4-deoxy-L-arabinose transferase-like glycosyltransferase
MFSLIYNSINLSQDITVLRVKSGFLKIIHSYAFWICAFLFIAVGWKVILLAMNSFSFNSDEAIVGLMAKHILHGEMPIFFYGQGYMGSLDAYFISLGFLLFGEKVWVIRMVQIVLYAGTMFVVLKVVHELISDVRAVIVTGILMAFPTVNVTLYTTVSLGGYGEALLFGSLMLYLARRYTKLKLPSDRPKSLLLLFLFGLLLGLGFWTNLLSLIIGIPCVLLIAIYVVKGSDWKNCLVGSAFLIAGFCIGALPVWLFAFKNGASAIVSEILGGYITAESTTWFIKILHHFVYFLIFGIPVILGVRPPWEIRWLMIPAIPVIVFIWVLVVIFLIRLDRERKVEKSFIWLLIGSLLLYFLVYVLSNFGTEPSGRYFLVLMIPLTVLFSISMKAVRKNAIVLGLAGLVGIYNFSATLVCALDRPTGLTTQIYEPSQIDHSFDGELIRFLDAHQITGGYTNYWVAYPIAFLSDEQITFVPALPYHLDLSFTTRDDRIPLYDTLVSESTKIAYITTRNPPLDLLIAQSFDAHHVSWQEVIIGDYHVIFDLSMNVAPQEIGMQFVDN